MIPESCKANKLLLYKCINFPNKWEKKCVLKNNFSCYDTTTFYCGKKFYLLKNFR